MTRLWLVRHAPTGARGMIGWTDPDCDLSDADALARLRAALPPAPVVSSDLRRATATADALAGARPRLPRDPGLREMSFGDWEGRTHADVAAEAPALARAIWDEPGAHAPPGGEGWTAFAARVGAAVDRLVGLGHADLVVVCHFGPILATLQRARGITAREAFAQSIEPLSLTVVRRTPAAWEVERVDHRP